MDFAELEAVEGLRWSWNSWPTTKAEATSLVIPLSVMFTPLMLSSDFPILSYEPLTCTFCGAALNPYARVDYASQAWHCPFCFRRNSFPLSYSGIGESSLPAELFPTYCTIEYKIGSNSTSHDSGLGPAFVFVVDAYISPVDEMKAMKSELLLALEQLPDNSRVALIVFDSMVRVYDLSFPDCSRAVVFHGSRDKLNPDQIHSFLGSGKFGCQKQCYLLPKSECEFNITIAIEEICPLSPSIPNHRPQRCTGAAISIALGLLEATSVTNGSRIMVLTSGPATTGPAIVVDSDLRTSMRTHSDLAKNPSHHYIKSRDFYKKLSRRLTDSSVILDLYACALDQVGAAEMKHAVDKSGGFMLLSDSFDSDQFRQTFRHVFNKKEKCLQMLSDASIEIVTTNNVKVIGALGPCVSLKKRNASVGDHEIGEGGTYKWKLGTLTESTAIAFFFEVNESQKPLPGSAFFIQFLTRYRRGNMSVCKRVTTAARRFSSNRTDVVDGFDQEAAASVVARLAVHRADACHAREVIRWLDDDLIAFASKFGDYIQEDSTSFRLSSSFSLYPQFMYYLRRSQFIDLFNSTPDETAFYRLMLNREGVMGSLVMVQPTLFRYSLEGPPVPVVLEAESVSGDAVLLFDSYFVVVIHYGAEVAEWRRAGYAEDENLRKLLEAPEIDARQLVSERVPLPKLIRCQQNSSQARFLLAKLSPSTDGLSLRDFMDHLQVLAVRG